MYDRAVSYPSPIGIVPLATHNWKAEKSRTQHFYGHSSTPKEYILQKLGLCISNCIALHIQDAKLGSLVPPTHSHDKDFTPPPPSDCVGVDSHSHPSHPHSAATLTMHPAGSHHMQPNPRSPTSQRIFPLSRLILLVLLILV